MKRKSKVTAAERSETRALLVLQNKHHFIIADSLRKSERDTTAMFRKGKEPWVLMPAVAVKLVVPADSALGRTIIELREETKAKKGKKSS